MHKGAALLMHPLPMLQKRLNRRAEKHSYLTAWIYTDLEWGETSCAHWAFALVIKESTDTWNMKYERQQGPSYLFLDLPTKINSKGRLVLFFANAIIVLFKVPNLNSNSLLFNWNNLRYLRCDEWELWDYLCNINSSELSFSIFSEVCLIR